MSDYYVSGCKSHDDDIVTCDDSEAQFWTIYKRDSMGLSQGIVDFTFREDANTAMRVYVERDELRRKLDAAEAASLALRDSMREWERKAISNFEQCGILQQKLDALAVENAALKGFVEERCWVYDDDVEGYRDAHNYLPETPATDAYLNSVRAEGLPKDYFSHLVNLARERAEKAMAKFPQPNYVLTKVAEECGELVKAGVHYAEGREDWIRVEDEAVDAIAMIYRLMTEGDQVIGFVPHEIALRTAGRAAKDGE